MKDPTIKRSFGHDLSSVNSLLTKKDIKEGFFTIFWYKARQYLERYFQLLKFEIIGSLYVIQVIVPMF